MKLNKAVFIALSLVLVLITTGCGKTQIDSTTNEPTAEVKNTESEVNEKTSEVADVTEVENQIVYGLFTSPTGIFNPIYADSDYDIIVNNLIYSYLLALDDSKNLVGSLAETYTVSEDNKTITFNLRKGITWHDGEPFDANDIIFTLNAMANPNYLGPLYGTIKKIAGADAVHKGDKEDISGVVAIDEHTISITFDEVFAPALTRLGTEVGILPEHIWKNKPVGEWKDATDLMSKPIGTGPFMFKEFVPGQFVELEANPNYFNGQPKSSSYIFKITNQDTAIASLVNGEIDLADVSSFKPKDIEELKSKGVEILSFAGKSYQYMGFNMREAVFSKKEVRQAITYAIDRALLIEKLVGGNGTLINAPMLPDTWQYPTEGLKKYPYEPDTAKELLKSVGYEDRNGDGIVEDENGNALSLTLKYPIGNKIREQYAPVIKQYLKEVGIEVELQLMEFTTLLDEAMTNHEFDMYLMGSSLSLDPDPTPYWSTQASSDVKGEAAWNIPAYRDSVSDELMSKGLGTLNVEERAEYYKEFAIRFNDNPPVVLLYAPNIIKAYSPKLKNYTATTFVNYYNVENWYVEK